MKKYFLFLIIFCFSISKAQETSIIKIDSATGGKLTITSDLSIIKMINDSENCKKPISQTSSTTNTSTTVGSNATESKPRTGNTYNTPKNICAKRSDIPGFMIKVAESKNEQEINMLMAKFRSEFPELRLEKSYLRPDWRLLAGDYFKRESGLPDLKKIRKNYPSSVLINWRIYCNRAK